MDKGFLRKIQHTRFSLGFLGHDGRHYPLQSGIPKKDFFKACFNYVRPIRTFSIHMTITVNVSPMIIHL